MIGGDPDPPRNLAGTVVGNRYRLESVLGKGATGTVWAAVDVTSGEPVAVKILHTRFPPGSPGRRRFEREVESASALRHPRSVVVHAHGQMDDGSDFLVMERLPARTLATLLRESGPLPPLRAIAIAEQILDALATAHSLNILHRDLKPGNVMLVAGSGSDDEPDQLKVCDFGLAKRIEPDDDGSSRKAGTADEAPTTGVGDLCGTPEYMAPEQARGDVLDGRADLYSVAVILFEAVVGRLPFTGRSALALVSKHLSEPPPRPSALRSDLSIPRPLENLILRGLAKHRSERPSSAEVFRADLLQLGRDIRTQERSQRAGERNPDEVATMIPGAVVPAARSYRWLWGALVGGGIAAGLLTLQLTNRRSAASMPQERPNPVTAAAAIVPPVVTAPDGTPPAPALAPVAPASVPPPRRRAAPRADDANHANFGTLNVSAMPVWATILVDGKDVGATPTVVSRVAAGRHVVEALPRGSPPAERRVVDVKPDAIVRVDFAFR
jgi:serine/threonine protein kinase